MIVKSFKDLIVWQKTMYVAKLVYLIIKKLLKEELFALSYQMRRAVILTLSNISEGQARSFTKEFVQFLAIANGSKAELETQLLLCVKIGYLSDTYILEPINQYHEIGEMLNALKNRLTTQH